MNTDDNIPGWIEAEKKFKQVIFSSSFANYRPTSTYKWFYEQTELTSFTGLSYLKTDNVTNMADMFYDCSSLTSLNLSGWDTGNVTDMTYMFGRCNSLTSLDLSGWDTRNVTNMSSMFMDCDGLTSLNVASWNTGKLKNMNNMFCGCSSLTSLDVSSWDTGQVTHMGGIFASCNQLKSLDVGGWNMANVTIIGSMFLNCSSLTSLNISGWNMSNVTRMGYMFGRCKSLTSLDLSGWDTAKVEDMEFMFAECSSLTSLNLSGWNTGKVTNMSAMFEGCGKLASLDVSGWDTSNVENMKGMFSNCIKLTSVNVSSWDTGNVTNMYGMFSNCIKLTSVNVSSWDTGKVTYMDLLFYNCNSLTSLNVSRWNTSNVTKMGYMFDDCSGLTSLDLSGWNTAEVTNMGFMFYDYSSLKTIYVGAGWNTGKVTSSKHMFYDCFELVGGSGTTYNSSYTDDTYARIDGGTSDPGYFSVKRYGIKIGGTQVTSLNMNDVFDDGGSVKFDGDKTLTLNNASISIDDEDGYGIYTQISDLVVSVSGNNTIESKQGTAFLAMAPVHFKGYGTLYLKGLFGFKSTSREKKDMSVTVSDGIHLICEGGSSGGGFKGYCVTGRPSTYYTTLTISGTSTIFEAQSVTGGKGSIYDIVGLELSDGQVIVSPTGATFNSTKCAVCNGSNIITDRVIIKNPSGIATGLEAQPQDKVQCSMFNVQCDGWYTIDGRKLSGKPAKKGVYIHNGKAVLH